MSDSAKEPARLRAGSRAARDSRTARAIWLRAGLITIAMGVAGLTAVSSRAAENANGSSADESQSDKLEEIVVTARKRSESLLDVPASIVAISDSVIKDTHMTQL